MRSDRDLIEVGPRHLVQPEVDLASPTRAGVKGRRTARNRVISLVLDLDARPLNVVPASAFRRA
jgi:hypothetical protein